MDDANWTVGGQARFLDGSGESLEFAFFCGSVQEMEVPPSTASVYVFVNGPLTHPLNEAGDRSYGPECNETDFGTHGIVNATWTME